MPLTPDTGPFPLYAGLDADSLAASRETEQVTFSDTWENLRASGSDYVDLEGVPVSLGDSVTATYPCRVTKGSLSRESVQSGEIIAESAYLVLLPFSADVRASDRGRVTSENFVSIYEVTDVRRETQALYLAAVCRRLSSEN